MGICRYPPSITDMRFTRITFKDDAYNATTHIFYQ